MVNPISESLEVMQGTVASFVSFRNLFFSLLGEALGELVKKHVNRDSVSSFPIW